MPISDTTRSRRGCATCKTRKKKCDEARPECRACVSRGVQCGGYDTRLIWGNAVASRGHLAGQTIPVKDALRLRQFSPSVVSASHSAPFDTAGDTTETGWGDSPVDAAMGPDPDTGAPSLIPDTMDSADIAPVSQMDSSLIVDKCKFRLINTVVPHGY